LGINTGSGTTLAITNSSTFIATAGTVLGANRGTIAVSDSATLQIGGTFNNSGEIGLSASGDPTSLLISCDTTLKGGGTVLMTRQHHCRGRHHWEQFLSWILYRTGHY
jgi:hypothetical protein